VIDPFWLTTNALTPIE